MNKRKLLDFLLQFSTIKLRLFWEEGEGISMKNEKMKEIPGISREEEESYLSATIDLAQTNLERVTAGIAKLKDEVDALMDEVNSSGEKDSLVLLNNADAQLKLTINSLSRLEKARKKPYFGRIDFIDENGKKEEAYYIGRVAIAKKEKEPAVIDWRTPVASVYYENAMGKGSYTVSAEGTFEIDLKRKRSYEIDNDKLNDFYDLDVVANDELLTKYLSKNKTEVLGEIIATIQKEQNRIIRRSPKNNLIVQGVAGSGKTTVAMHRISYILYNYEKEFRPEDFYIIGSNRILLNYITSVLPELDVYGVSQMTMEQLFVRLLYEDWDKNKYSIKQLDRENQKNGIKGSSKWFYDLEQFGNRYERQNIARDAVYLEKTGKLLIGRALIEGYIKDHPQMSMQSKRLMLNEILYSKYENEILGKGISFPAEEKKILDNKYRYYFGKDEWKGSLYDIYQSFLMGQVKAGYDIDIPDTEFDVYDLAALAYLYKRIKEIDPIREASHVVIDEAQDFGMMAYHALHYCMRGCTYTIMGDTSQNIHFEYGLNDWDELRKLILTGSYDKFELLRKSYRNTVEISEFATEVLRHGDFSIYPVEPIIRHGLPVNTYSSSSMQEKIDQTAAIIKNWQAQGYETIAVICRDEKEVAAVTKDLGKQIPLKETSLQMAEFGNGVMVLPVVYTKGLEFDAVLIFDPTIDKYPADNGHVKMLYVTATRALHELSIVCGEDISPLLSTKAPKEKHLEEFLLEQTQPEVGLSKKTKKELIEEERSEGHKDMARRDYLGPKRVTLQENALNPASKVEIRKTISPRASVKIAPEEGHFIHKYADIPSEEELRVIGHSKSNHAVRWIKKTKQRVEVVSSYGTLLLTPIADAALRIQFTKGQQGIEKEWDIKGANGIKWSAKESPSAFELAMPKLIVHIQKKDGAISFLSLDRKVLLNEKVAEPRLIEGKKAWNFFDFEKKEKLKVKGILADSLTDVSLKGRYMSYGGKPMKMPLLLSNKGYGIAVASKSDVLFSGIPSFGMYINMAEEQVDYLFLYEGTIEKNIALYNKL